MSYKSHQLIKDHDVKWVDLRFTDTKGKQQHVTMPARDALDDEFFEAGKMFDGSSIAGWKGIEASDMILMPDDSTAVLDPFTEEPTLILVCDIIEPSTMQGYERDPRNIAKRAEEYLKSTGIGDTVFVGPEPEFFIFDEVKFKSDISGSMFKIFSEQASWNTDADIESGNKGHRPGVKGGYFPVPPVDHDHEIRTAMCNALEEMGLVVEVHHHEVATAGQNEIGVKFNTLVAKADEVQTLKYCVHNVADAYGKTVTFMPKPLYGDNGSGMHVHMSISKDGKNTFAGEGYAGLSETALYFIGGIIKHGKALNGFTNPSTNSYKRLVPGFEAPVMLAYSARNRSASIRIPEGPPYRSALPGPGSQPLPGLRRAADGRPGRHPEQDPPRRCRRQEPVRPAAGRGEGNPAGLRQPERGAGRTRQGPRVPDQGRRVHRRVHRCLHRAEERRRDQGAHLRAPAGIRPVLQRLIHPFL